MPTEDQGMAHRTYHREYRCEEDEQGRWPTDCPVTTVPLGDAAIVLKRNTVGVHVAWTIGLLFNGTPYNS